MMKSIRDFKLILVRRALLIKYALLKFVQLRNTLSYQSRVTYVCAFLKHGYIHIYIFPPSY